MIGEPEDEYVAPSVDEVWAGIDPDDPKQVARALAEIGMRAGGQASVLAHMHARIGRALDEFTRATDALGALATREELEAKVNALERRQDEQRAADRRAATTRLIVVVAVAVLVVTVIAAAVALNRSAVTTAERRDREAEARSAAQIAEVTRRQEITAICTRTNGTEATIVACIAERLNR